MVIFDDMVTSRGGLARLSRTCQALNAISFPVLLDLKKACPSPRRLDFKYLSYARSILRDPSLAAREEFFTATQYTTFGALELSDYELLDRQSSLHKPGVPLADLDQFRFGNSCEDRERTQGNKSDLLVIILTSLPNLSTISIHDEFRLEFFPLQSLPTLKEAHLDAYTGNLGQEEEYPRLCDMTAFKHLFTIAPNFERLKIDRCYDCYEPSDLRNIRSIEITNSSIMPEALPNLLGRCVKLERFVYSSIGHDACGQIDDEEFWDCLSDEAKPSDFLNELLPASSSLQELRLVTCPEFRHWGQQDDIDIGPEELKPFTALRHSSFEEIS
ncbi:hypothetical protein F5Y16DRAFT_418326 [Xylariaceae sp. FL0255]|nr:hypothetical protein F5Y16DRAFT_418326 [Xylariaceae sp. FL0255]